MLPAFLERFIDPRTQLPRHRGFWFVLGTLVALQLFALWMLCSHQVSKAQARQAQVHLQQLARADCLRATPGSTIGSCVGAHARAGAGAPPEGALASADTAIPGVPVGYTIR
jgi:hypothetical protein